MPLLYNIGVGLYHLGIKLAAPFNPKAKLWLHGRKGVFEDLKQRLKSVKKPIWVHCSSYGEYEQGRPIIEALQAAHPGKKIVLTFYSPSGYEVVKQTPGNLLVLYLPQDGHSNATRFLEIVDPSFSVFVKYEFWFHYLQELKGRHIPTYLVSAIFRKSQPFFQWYGSTHRKMLACFTIMFVQDETSKTLLKQAGFEDVQVSGDTRFDRVAETAAQNERSEKLEAFTEESKNVLVAGSSWPKDEALIAHFMNNTDQELKLVIAPHEVDPTHINAIKARFNEEVVLWSSLDQIGTSKAKVLIIDTIGQLSRAYKYGTIAYVGGGFDSGIHNVLEPAAFGLPIIFGPKFEKFREAKELLALGAAELVEGQKSFDASMSTLTKDEQERKRRAELSAVYVAKNKGATNKILEEIETSPRGGT